MLRLPAILIVLIMLLVGGGKHARARTSSAARGSSSSSQWKSAVRLCTSSRSRFSPVMWCSCGDTGNRCLGVRRFEGERVRGGARGGSRAQPT